MPLPIAIRDTPAGCTFQVRVHPGAKHDAIQGTHQDALKISLNAPPVDGRANEALSAFLAERLALPRSRVEILHGHASRTKTVRIVGMTPDEVLDRLSTEEA